MPKICILLFIMGLVYPSNGQIASWRGENRSGHFYEENLLKIWPEDGPELLFSVEGIGKGWSSAIIAGQRIYINGKIDSLEYLSAIDLNGEIIWQVPYGRSWNKAYPETRGSVTVDADRLYVISGQGVLSCFDKEQGSVLWTVDADDKFGAVVSNFGTAESPLIVDNKVICTPAGQQATMVAFDKITGELIWQSKSIGGKKSYMSPILYSYKDRRYILNGTDSHIFAVSPDDGEIVWMYKHYDRSRERNKEEWGKCIINSLVCKDDEILVTRGYDYPAIMLKIDSTGSAVKEKWVNPTLDNEHGGIVLVDNHIYGSNYGNNAKWVCLDWDTGEVTFLQKWNGSGSIVTADGMLYLYDGKRGNIGLVRPNPKEFELVSSFKIFKGTGQHWSHLSIFNGIMYVRRGNVLMAYDVRRKE